MPTHQTSDWIEATVHRLAHRELYGNQHEAFGNFQVWTDDIIEHLGVAARLEGHAGCVNTLRWSHSGNLLASGSDDRKAKIWGCDGQLLHTISTGHDHNIFGAEFIPNHNDQLIATSSGDHTARLHNLEYKDELCVWRAEGRVKRLATANDEAHLFWSASEDGAIRQYDVRTNDETKIVAEHDSYKSLAICPGRTELLALACIEEFVPIYDRRNTAKQLMSVQPGDYNHGDMQRRYPTHVGFDELGKELLVNMGGGSVYVFDIASPEESRPMVWDQLDNILAEDCGPQPQIKPTGAVAEKRALAKRFLEEKAYLPAYDAYSAAFMECPEELVDDRSIMLANRAMVMLARQEDGDYYECVRDCVRALGLAKGNAKALYRLTRALILLRRLELAKACVELFKKRFPDDKSYVQLEKKIDDVKNNRERIWSTSRDYKERYTAHRNNHTDIKEAAFIGGKEGWIAAGSDCGNMYIWERKTGRLRAAFKADEDILNIVQPHPILPLIATSGIEKDIRFWGPLPEGKESAERHADPYDAVIPAARSAHYDMLERNPVLLHSLQEGIQSGRVQCANQ
ncbi:unnamed protein product, partial [Mesorhabditis spiculigera]